MRNYLSKAIEDIEPGTPGPRGITDYTHLLPESLRNEGYTMGVADYIDPQNGVPAISTIASRKVGEHKYRVGEVKGFPHRPVLRIVEGVVHDRDDRGKGIGMSMYEALYRHAKDKHGIERVRGGKHSTSAHGLHQKLAEKHGLSYEAEPNVVPEFIGDAWETPFDQPPDSYDNRYRTYSYTLKNDEWKVSNATPTNDPMTEHDDLVEKLMRERGLPRNVASAMAVEQLNPGIHFPPSTATAPSNVPIPPPRARTKEDNLVIPGRFRVKYERNLDGWKELEQHEHAAMEQAGYTLQKHIDAAARMLGRDAELPMERVRPLLKECDDISEAVLKAFYAYSPENESRLEVFLNDTDLLKRESLAGLSGMEAYKIAPVNQEATGTADAIQRAVDAGYLNPVKLNGKHSRGAMLAKDPQTKIIYLLKPGSGKNSPARGVNEDGSSQSEREAAFWHVAHLLGIGDVFPRADLILINGHQTAALELLPFSFQNLGERKKQDKGLPPRLLEPYRNNTTLFKWSFIDYVLGNPDRHSQNIMVDPNNKIVRLIDHGSAFAGSSFSPAEDENSFIPFYLRAWTDRKFTQMTPEERLRYMPTLGGRQEQAFDEWVAHIDEHRIVSVLKDYNVNPQPALERIAKIRAMSGPKWNVLNRLWAGSI